MIYSVVTARNSRFGLVFAVGIGIFKSAAAGPVLHQVEPKIFWSPAVVSSCGQFFETPEAAFSAYQCYIDEQNRVNSDTLLITVSGLRPKIDGHYINKKPTDYIADLYYNYVKDPSKNYNAATQVASASGWECPTKPVAWGRALVPGNNNSYSTVYCQLTGGTRDVIEGSCPFGDPLHSNGLQVEETVDYRSANGLLEYKRTYRSDISSVTSAMTKSGFYDYSLDAGSVLGGCVNLPYSGSSTSGQSGNYCFPYISTGTQEAVLWRSDGRITDFTITGGAYVPSSNTQEKVTKFTNASGATQWRIRRKENFEDTYSTVGTLLSRTWANGQKVSFNYSASSTPLSSSPRSNQTGTQVDSFGRTLTFFYDAGGRVARMQDPAGQVYTYSYDSTSPGCAGLSCDRLISVQYPDQFSLNYLWNESAYVGASLPDALTGINELWPATGGGSARTVRINTFRYDGQGRAVSTERTPGVDLYSLSNDTGDSVQIMDARGNLLTQTYSLLFGSTYAPTSISQPMGAGCNASANARVYDSSTGNVTQRDDFNGHRTCYAYDGNNRETTRLEGLSSTTACSSYMPSGVDLPGGTRKTSTQWHPDWRFATKVAEPGRLTTSVYNGQPDPFNGNAIASCAPAAATLPDGKPIAVLCKQVEQATTDADGHLGFSAALQSGVPNRVYQWTYNQYGQVLTATDPLSHTTTYAYYSDTTADHTMGDLQSVTNALNQVTQFTKYNPHGQVLQMVDANSITTDYQYDLRQRLKSVSTAGQITTYDYWPTGLLKQVNLPDSSYISYTYDDAHRLTDIADNLGNSVHYTLDNAGTRTKEEVKDPSGTLKRWLQRVPDALGRVQQTNGRE